MPDQRAEEEMRRGEEEVWSDVKNWRKSTRNSEGEGRLKKDSQE